MWPIDVERHYVIFLMMHILFSTCVHLCNFTHDIQNKNSEQQNMKTKTKDFQNQSSDKTLGWEEILESIEGLSSSVREDTLRQ